MTTTAPRAARGSAALAAPDADAAPLAGRAGRVLTLVAALGAAVGILAGLVSGPLWLDEAQSVAIARLPVGELPQALREDGAPPLYYLLLHAWIGVAGEGAVAVRLPSAVLGALALVLVHLLGRRLGGPTLGRVSLIVLAGLPWFSRYAAEARMYLLVVDLVLGGALALLALRTRPSPAAFAGVAACTGALLLTHYWSLFLLAAVGVWQLPALLRRSRGALRTVAAMAVGSLVFLPWLPSFRYQADHTGAPWAGPASLEALLRTPEMWSAGAVVPRVALALAYVALAAQALRAPGPARLAAARLAGLTAATLGLAWLSTVAVGGAYVGRYTAVVVPLVAVLLALGVLALPARRQVPVLAAVVGVGLVVGGLETGALRTQGGEVGEALARTAAPGDVVLFCPDQLGPSVTRVAPDGLRLLGYPLQERTDRVDWVDYADRQAAAFPGAVARQVDALAGPAQVFVDFAPGYRTYGHDCQQVVSSLTHLRGEPVIEVERRLAVFEEQRLYRFPGR
jgi:mannosyltransferase